MVGTAVRGAAQVFGQTGMTESWRHTDETEYCHPPGTGPGLGESCQGRLTRHRADSEVTWSLTSSFHFSGTSRELLHASGQVLPDGHGRLRLDRSSRRLEPLVSDSHPALRGQGHETPAWRTQVFGGLKQGKSARSSTQEQRGANRLTKHLKHFLRN